jgi:hypothetical protein
LYWLLYSKSEERKISTFDLVTLTTSKEFGIGRLLQYLREKWVKNQKANSSDDKNNADQLESKKPKVTAVILIP